MTSLIQLLETIEANRFVETYRNFPDVALSGGQFLDKEEIDRLISEGYLQPTTQDYFGQFLELSSRAKEVLKKSARRCVTT